MTGELRGYVMRPLALTDAPAVADLEQSQARIDRGIPRSVHDIRAAWSRHDFDPATTTHGVFDGTILVAFAEHLSGDRCLATARRGYREQLFPALSQWLVDSAAVRGQTRLILRLREESPEATILTNLQWTERSRSWMLEVDPERQPPTLPLPEGVTVAEAAPGEYPTIWSLTQHAYREGSERRRQSLAEWRSATIDQPGFAPWQLRVAREASGAVVGTALLRQSGGDGSIERIAVVPQRRARGLGRALVSEALTTLADHGAVRRSLETDSWQGVRTLQRAAGMLLTATWVSLGTDVAWPASVPALSTDVLAERLGEAGGVFLVHGRDTLDALLDVLQERDDRVITVDASAWQGTTDMYADLRSRLRLSPYYHDPSMLPEALTELVASEQPAGLDRPCFALVLDRFDAFMGHDKAGALGLVDALAAAARNAPIDEHRLSVILHTADRTLRLTQATVVDEPS